MQSDPFQLELLTQFFLFVSGRGKVTFHNKSFRGLSYWRVFRNGTKFCYALTSRDSQSECITELRPETQPQCQSSRERWRIRWASTPSYSGAHIRKALNMTYISKRCWVNQNEVIFTTWSRWDVLTLIIKQEWNYGKKEELFLSLKVTGNAKKRKEKCMIIKRAVLWHLQMSARTKSDLQTEQKESRRQDFTRCRHCESASLPVVLNGEQHYQLNATSLHSAQTLKCSNAAVLLTSKLHSREQPHWVTLHPKWLEFRRTALPLKAMVTVFNWNTHLQFPFSVLNHELEH